MRDLDPATARRIIEVVGSSGQPPEWGLHRFTAGLDDYLDVLDRDYFSSYIRQGGASFKMVVGAFGGGKTHSLYCIRELAWRHGFVVSYCPLSAEESPFHRLERVYKSMVDNLMLPIGPEGLTGGGVPRGLDPFLREQHRRFLEEAEAEGDGFRSLKERYEERLERSRSGVENINFARAVTAALRALYEERSEDYLHILQWLTATGYDRHTHRAFGILEPVGRGQAFSMIRSVAQWIRNLEGAGLVILFDEAEQVPSLTSRQRDLLLSNLRELIDQCGHASFPGVMIFYAVPNEALFEGKSAVYEALKQRIATVFDLYNPSGVKIYLENLKAEPVELLREIGGKLFEIYSIPWPNEIPRERVDRACARLARAAFEERFGDIGYKRLFVQAAIRAFHTLRNDPTVEPDGEWAAGLVREGLS
jgi:hypothetical protein